jgi:hypothetical protein
MTSVDNLLTLSSRPRAQASRGTSKFVRIQRLSRGLESGEIVPSRARSACTAAISELTLRAAAMLTSAAVPLTGRDSRGCVVVSGRCI